jgi:hypothetical protein
MLNILHAVFGRPHAGHPAVRIAIGGVAGGLLLGGFRSVLHYAGMTEPFYIRFSYTNYEHLFKATINARFPDVAVLPGGFVAVLLILLVASIWEYIYRLP